MNDRMEKAESVLELIPGLHNLPWYPDPSIRRHHPPVRG
jgi:hypothetical protein